MSLEEEDDHVEHNKGGFLSQLISELITNKDKLIAPIISTFTTQLVNGLKPYLMIIIIALILVLVIPIINLIMTSTILKNLRD